MRWSTSVIPASWKVEIRRISVQGQPRQKVSKTPISTNKLGVVVCVYDPSCARDKGRWIMVTVQVCPQVKR
jgi:hypothetical protein